MKFRVMKLTEVMSTVNVNVNAKINVDVNVNVNVKVNVYVDVNVNVHVNVNDVSLQPVPTQPRTFELFASVRGGGHAKRKTFVVIANGMPALHKRSSFRKRLQPRASVRASASACCRPACKNVGGMSACQRHDAADAFANS